MQVTSAVGLANAPTSIRTLDTFERPDYVDLFTARAPSATDASPEQWARALLEESTAGRRFARILWHALGLRLGPRRSPDHVQGWKIADRGDDWIRLETASWFMTAHAVLRIDENHVSVSVSIRYDHPIAAIVWAPVSLGHRRAVPGMLRQAVRLQEARR